MELERDRANDSAERARVLSLLTAANATLEQGRPPEALALAVAASQRPVALEQSQLVLSRLAYAPGVRRVFDQPGGVTAVAYSPDAQRAIVVGDDDVVRTWRITDGRLLASFQPQSDQEVTAVALSQDGRLYATGDDRGNIVVWEVEQQRRLWSQSAHQGPVVDLAFDGGGATLISGGVDDSQVRLWSALGGDNRGVLQSDTTVSFVDFSGNMPVVGDTERVASFFDPASLLLSRRLQISGSVFASSPDGQVVAMADYVSVALWDTLGREPLWRQRGGNRIASVAQISPDGRQLLIGNTDGSLELWDLLGRRQLAGWEDRGRRITALAFSPDGRRAIVGGVVQDQTSNPPTTRLLQLVDLVDGSELYSVEGAGVTFDLDPSGLQVLVQIGKSLVLRDLRSGATLQTFTEQQSSILSVAYSADGHSVLSVDSDGVLQLWDAITGIPGRRLVGDSSKPIRASFSPDGRVALVIFDDHTIRLWNIADGQILQTLAGHTEDVRAARFSPDGTMILSGAADNTVRLWDSATGQLLLTLSGHTDTVQSVAFSPDGRRAISGAFDNTARVWDLTTGKERRRIETILPVLTVDWNPALPLLLTSTSEGFSGSSLALWDADTGQQIRSIDQPNVLVGARFDPSGRMIAGTEFELEQLQSSLRVWRIDDRDTLLAWTLENRFVPDLSCDQLAFFGLEPGCDRLGQQPPTPRPAGVAPSPLPTTPPNLAATPTASPRFVVVAARVDIPAGTFIGEDVFVELVEIPESVYRYGRLIYLETTDAAIGKVLVRQVVAGELLRSTDLSIGTGFVNYDLTEVALYQEPVARLEGVIGQVYGGDELQFIQSTTADDGQTWYRVRVTQLNAFRPAGQGVPKDSEGWLPASAVSGPYLSSP